MHKIKILFPVVVLLCFVADTKALPGDLDPVFGPVGFVTTSLSSTADRAFAAALQTDGKIVAAGSRNNGGSFAVVRYNSDGTLDTTFDGDGIVSIFIGNFGSEARSLAIQADGRIVVGGSSSNNPFTVIRLNSNGSLDTTFSGDGIFTDSTVGSINALALQGDGKIVTAGTATINFFTSDYSIVRLDSDGTFDSTFGGDGRVFVNIADQAVGGMDSANAIAVQPDGKIIAGGDSQFLNTSRDWSLVRLNADGSLDASFDGDGRVRTTFGGNNEIESINSIAIENNGRIVAAGFGGEDLVRGFAVARYNTDGSPDTSFSIDGKVVTAIGSNNGGSANSVAVQADGRIVAAGSGILENALVRYNVDGSLDSSFSGDGRAFLTVNPNGATVARGVLIEPDGKIITVGNAARDGADDDFLLARFNTDGTPSTDLGTFGYVTTNPFNETTRSSSARGLALQPDGKIIVAANSIVNESTSIGLILRYTSDGRLDPAFIGSSGSGIVSINVPGAATQEINAVIVQPDGKILAVGSYENDSQDDLGIFVVQLNADGSRNLSFGGNGNGFVIIGITSGGGLGQDLALQADGKIVIAGGAANFQTQTIDFAVYRLNPDGTADNAFGVNGRATTGLGSGNDLPLSILLQPDGRIVLGGLSDLDENFNSQAAAVRFTSDGVADNSFGIGGDVILPLSGCNDSISDLGIQTDGRIIASGVRGGDFDCSSQTGVLLRLNSNGSLDSSFDGDGLASPVIPNSLFSELTSLAIQPDGKIVGSGTTFNESTRSDNLVVRYDTNGLLDTTFSGDGIMTSDIGTRPQISSSVLLQPDGKIVTAGSISTGTRDDVIVWRYIGDQPVSANVSITGRVTTPGGLNLRNAAVTITDSEGGRQTAFTGPFGIYSFGNVTGGQTFVISVSSKRYRFASRSLLVSNNLSDVDFVGLE